VSTTDETSLDERLFAATVGALELFGVYVGDRLGLYDALRDGRAVTPGELADACGIHPRYAREWLEQQAVAGVLAVDDVSAAADPRRYRVPASHAGVLTDPTDGAHVAPFARMVVGIANAMEDVIAAYRTGGGVPYSRYGADFHHGQGSINRPAFTTALVDEWLPAMRGATERLRAGGRVADIGAGHGWAAIAVARALPDAELWAFDSDAASIEEARGHAEGAGARVRFEVADATSLASRGPFDLVMLLEVLHDLARPVEVLAAARAALADGGAVLVADEAVTPSFTAPGDDLERMMYGWSIAHCLPSSMAEQPSAAIGTAIREDTVRELAREAGFGRVDVLDADGGFFRLYELRD
jgi:2-polyprenyl-3-methyl-5-hydroxy-6-metoxy-1,4-benzoquinol methylase